MSVKTKSASHPSKRRHVVIESGPESAWLMELPDDITLEKLRYDHKSNVNELIGTKWIWLRPGPHLNREYTIVSDADYVSREWEAAVESGLISISSFLANIRKFWCKSFVGHTGKPCIFCDYDGDQTVQYIPLRTAP